jgi:hypothetical protein
VGLLEEPPPAEAPPPVPAAPEPPLVAFEPVPPAAELSGLGVVLDVEVSSAGVVLPAEPDSPSAAAPLEDSAAPEAVSSVEPLLEAFVVEVVAVVLVRVASLSAEVLLGGVISGVLRGVATETPPPPQAASARLQTITSASALSSARAAPLLLGAGAIGPDEPSGARPRAAQDGLRPSPRAPLTRPAGPSADRR